MRTLRVPVADDVELAVDLWDGRGREPFLLAHGLASNARLWDGVADDLAGRGHPVAVVDQRGHGRSAKPDGGYDFATLADDLVRVIGALALDRPVAVGQSWGADVVLELAARRPGAVRGVACVDGGTTELARRFPTWEECESALAPPPFRGTPLAEIEARFRRAHPDWPERGIRGALACFEVLPDGTVAPHLTFERHMTILRHLWSHRPSRLWDDIGVPVLLLPCRGSGEWAAMKRASVEEAERRLARARTHWFDAHHDVHAQHPDRVAAVLAAAVDDGFFAVPGPVAAGEMAP